VPLALPAEVEPPDETVPEEVAPLGVPPADVDAPELVLELVEEIPVEPRVVATWEGVSQPTQPDAITRLKRDRIMMFVRMGIADPSRFRT
jgi:hypothetical protein